MSYKYITFILNSPEILTRLRMKNSLNSGSLSEMACRVIGLVSSPVVKVMKPDVLVNSWFSSRGVTESLANSCQKTVTLPKCPLARRTLGKEEKRVKNVSDMIQVKTMNIKFCPCIEVVKCKWPNHQYKTQTVNCFKTVYSITKETWLEDMFLTKNDWSCPLRLLSPWIPGRKSHWHHHWPRSPQ